MRKVKAGSKHAAKVTRDKEEARRVRNQKARERHWRKTGVSDSTVRWMKEYGWL